MLNGRCLLPPRAGVGRYGAALLAGLEKHGQVERTIAFFGSALSPRGRLAERLWATPLLPRLAGRLLAGPALRHHARRLKGALYFEPNYVLVRYEGPAVATVHDLSTLRFPEFQPARRVRFLERHLAATVDRADHLLTVSEFVRREMIELLGVKPERVSAIHSGVDAAFHPRAADDPTLLGTLARRGLEPGAYLLSVATFEPRKNLEGLVAAYANLPAAQRRAYPLVLVGAPGWKNESLQQALDKLGDRGEVRRLGFVPEAELPLLYAGARLFVYPSLYEGFGLPPLEAMASGTPVITSSGTAMEEVAGGAATLIEPRNTEALRDAISGLLAEPEKLAVQREQGLKRAQTLTWQRTVDQAVDIFRRVIEQRDGRAL